MAKGKWKYRDLGDLQFGICYDGIPDNGRFVWMALRGSFQISLARLICRELNRAGVEIEINEKFMPEVVARKSSKKAKG